MVTACGAACVLTDQTKQVAGSTKQAQQTSLVGWCNVEVDNVSHSGDQWRLAEGMATTVVLWIEAAAADRKLSRKLQVILVIARLYGRISANWRVLSSGVWSLEILNDAVS